MKKGFLISAALSVWIMVVFTSCVKEEVVPATSDATQQNPTDDIVDSWPNGMVHLNELDTIK